MIKKFFISKKLDEYASAVEKNAEKEADNVVEGIKGVLEATEFVGLILQVCASAYRMVRVALTLMVSDSPEGKAFRDLVIEFEKAFAKRLRASSGFVTTLTKNKKVMRAIEAFEEDWEELKGVMFQREKSEYLEEIDEHQKSFDKKFKKAKKEETVPADKLKKLRKIMSEAVLKGRSLICGLESLEELRDSLELEARLQHVEELDSRFPNMITLKEDKHGGWLLKGEGGFWGAFYPEGHPDRKERTEEDISEDDIPED